MHGWYQRSITSAYARNLMVCERIAERRGQLNRFSFWHEKRFSYFGNLQEGAGSLIEMVHSQQLAQKITNTILFRCWFKALFFRFFFNFLHLKCLPFFWRPEVLSSKFCRAYKYLFLEISIVLQLKQVDLHFVCFQISAIRYNVGWKNTPVPSMQSNICARLFV